MRGITNIVMGLSAMTLVASCSSSAITSPVTQVESTNKAARFELLNTIPECPATCIAASGASQFTDTSSLNYQVVDQGTNDQARISVFHGGVSYFGGVATNPPTTINVVLTDPNTDTTPEVHLQGILRDTSGNLVTFQYDFAVDPSIPVPGFGYGTVILGTETFADREGAATFFPDLCTLPAE